MPTTPNVVYRSTYTSSPTPLTTIAILRALLQTDRPVSALYRGLTPNLLGNATSWASFFFFKSRFERAIACIRSSATRDGQKRENHRLTPLDFFLASLLSGIATQLLTNPIWVLKTRMLALDASAQGAYPSMLSGARQLLRDEGWKGFYRGLGVGMLAVSHGAVQFAVYEPGRRLWVAAAERVRRSRGTSESNREAGLSNEATVVLSTVSKLVAGTVTYPLQVLRSRLQYHEAERVFGRGLRGVVGQLWREEGVRGFYRGLVPGVVRVMPATWVTFLVYENVKWYLPRWIGEREIRVV